MTAPAEDRKVHLILSPTLVRLVNITELEISDLVEVVVPKEEERESLEDLPEPRFAVHLVRTGFRYTAGISTETAREVILFLTSEPDAFFEDAIVISRATPSSSPDNSEPIRRQYQKYVMYTFKGSRTTGWPEQLDCGDKRSTHERCKASFEPQGSTYVLENALLTYPFRNVLSPSDEDLYGYLLHKRGTRWITLVDQCRDQGERVYYTVPDASALKILSIPKRLSAEYQVLIGISIPLARFECVESWSNRGAVLDWVHYDYPSEYVEGTRITIMRESFDQGSKPAAQLFIAELFKEHLATRSALIDITEAVLGASASTVPEDIQARADRKGGQRDNISTADSPLSSPPPDHRNAKAQLAELDTQARALALLSTPAEIKQLFDGISLLPPLDKGKGRASPSLDYQQLFDGLSSWSSRYAKKQEGIVDWPGGSRSMEPNEGPKEGVSEPEDVDEPTVGQAETSPISSVYHVHETTSEAGEPNDEAHPAVFNNPITCGDLSDELSVLSDRINCVDSDVPSSPSIVALSRLETPTYIHDLLEKPNHTTASTRLLRIMRDEKVKLDSSLGLKLLDFVQALKRGGELSPVDVTSDAETCDEVDELKTLQINSFNKTSERLNDFAEMLNAIAEAVGVNLQEGDEQEPSTANVKDAKANEKGQEKEKEAEPSVIDTVATKDQSWEELRFRHIAEFDPAIQPVEINLSEETGRILPSTMPESIRARLTDARIESERAYVERQVTALRRALHAANGQRVYPSTPGSHATWTRSAPTPPAVAPPVPARNPFINYGTIPKPFAAPQASAKDDAVTTGPATGEMSCGGPMLKNSDYICVAQSKCGSCEQESSTGPKASNQGTSSTEPVDVPRPCSMSGVGALEPELTEYAPMVPNKNEQAPPAVPLQPAQSAVPPAAVPARPAPTQDPAPAVLAPSQAGRPRRAVARTAQPPPNRPMYFHPHARTPYSRIPAPSTNEDEEPLLAEQRSAHSWRDLFLRPHVDRPPLTNPSMMFPTPSNEGPQFHSMPPVLGENPFGGSSHNSFDHWAFGPPEAHAFPYSGEYIPGQQSFEQAFPPPATSGIGPGNPGGMYPGVPFTMMPYPYSPFQGGQPFW